MPLYDSIRLPGKADDKKPDEGSKPNKTANTSSASLKFLHDHLLSKKRSKQLSSHKTVVQQLDSQIINYENTVPIRRFCGEPCDWDPQDEYEPMMPNSYEILQADYLEAEKQRLLAKQNRTGRGINAKSSLLEALNKLDDIEDESEKRNTRGTAIAPPPTLVSARGSEQKSQSSQEVGLDMPTDATTCTSSSRSHRLEQTEPGQGQFLQPSTTMAGSYDTDRVHQAKATEPQKALDRSTRVVLLQNMVGPGEVDDDLEAETKEECSKYGEVIRCLIYEIPNKRVPDDQAVRIFVEFRTEDAAKSAVNDLNGRYFGGKVVQAAFYDTEKFSRYQLGP